MLLRKKSRGFTLPEVMIGIAIIGLLLALAIPGLLASRKRAKDRLCQNHLRLIQKALKEYMVVEGVFEDDNASAVYQGVIVGAPDAYIEEEPLTPVGNRSYSVTTFGADPTCPNRDDDPTDSEFIKHIIE